MYFLGLIRFYDFIYRTGLSRFRDNPVRKISKRDFSPQTGILPTLVFRKLFKWERCLFISYYTSTILCIVFALQDVCTIKSRIGFLIRIIGLMLAFMPQELLGISFYPTFSTVSLTLFCRNEGDETQRRLSSWGSVRSKAVEKTSNSLLALNLKRKIVQ